MTSKQIRAVVSKKAAELLRDAHDAGDIDYTDCGVEDSEDVSAAEEEMESLIVKLAS